ncbi:hypothetical protein GCM10027026_26780 [Myroides odoratimimus subsp. xuanwuensis]
MPTAAAPKPTPTATCAAGSQWSKEFMALTSGVPRWQAAADPDRVGRPASHLPHGTRVALG